jgi:hypothetical protein
MLSKQAQTGYKLLVWSTDWEALRPKSKKFMEGTKKHNFLLEISSHTNLL